MMSTSMTRFVAVLLICLTGVDRSHGLTIAKNQNSNRNLRFILDPDVEFMITPHNTPSTTTSGPLTNITTPATAGSTTASTSLSNGSSTATTDEARNESTTISTPLSNNNTTSEPKTRCKLCTGSYCPFIEVDQECPSGLCMSSVIDSKLGDREYVKSCVSLYECKRKAEDSSDRCMDQYSKFRGPTSTDMTCHFCCVGDLCNAKVFPDLGTLYNFTSSNV